MATAAPTSYSRKPPKLIGNSLAVDFVNTVGWRGRPEAPEEHLTDYAELAIWAQSAGIVSAATARRLVAEGARRPAAAASVLTRAIATREALARLLAGRRPPRPRDLALVNDLLLSAPARTALAFGEGGYRWRGRSATPLLELPLWPIVWDAAAILTSDRRRWVRGCADTECGWLFLDLSRNRTRRWCSMDDCGNRAKARRHYARRVSVGS